MDNCPDCGVVVTPSDSNAGGVCVNCQEYNYYHQEDIPVKGLLYKGVIVQLDGERSYNYDEYVIAPSLQDAQEHFEGYLKTWFGDDTRPQADGEVWDSSWEVAAKLDYVVVSGGFTVETVEGESIHVSFVID